ncbi:MAG: SPOR domain-containing protein, partial [Porticoccaceae bacterium]|nr:SPOR domain-containing protein [Porticoccaceae bacterium]
AYLLQVGSFKNKPDAESLRVQLLLLNLEAFVEPFETSSGDTWYRVLVGPFDSDSKSASARAKLSDNNLESLLLKRNNSSNAQPTER